MVLGRNMQCYSDLNSLIFHDRACIKLQCWQKVLRTKKKRRRLLEAFFGFAVNVLENAVVLPEIFRTTRKRRRLLEAFFGFAKGVVEDAVEDA